MSGIREARHRLAADGPPRARSGGDFERVSVPVSDSDVLRDLLLAEKAVTVIEIGLAYGSSALAIAEALAAAGSNEVRHVIVDPYQKLFHGSGWAAITEAGLAGLCSLVEERSQIALPRLLGDGFVADAAFVDGSHVFHNVFAEAFYPAIEPLTYVWYQFRLTMMAKDLIDTAGPAVLRRLWDAFALSDERLAGVLGSRVHPVAGHWLASWNELQGEADPENSGGS